MFAGSNIAGTVLGAALVLSGVWMWFQNALTHGPLDDGERRSEFGDQPNVPEGLWGTRGELRGKGKDARAPHRHADTGPVAHHDKPVDNSCRS